MKPLFRTMPRSGVYRVLAKLVETGHVRKDGTSYCLLRSGREALEAAATPSPSPMVAPTLAEHLPHLRHAPTPFHGALLELIACAIVARCHRIRPSHHPAFVIFGPKLKWKTWITRAACTMAGGDPTRDVIYLGTETGKSMFLRKDAKGRRVTIRQTLDKLVVGLDEYLRAKPDVRQLLHVYLFGDISVPEENTTLTIQPVPIVTLNPRETEASLEDRLGLDEAMLRRSILADLSHVVIPQKLLTEGDGLIDKMRGLGAAEFPKPRRPDWEPRDAMKEVLLSALDTPERLAGIDITMLAMLATAATAWLEPEAALRLVATNYLSIVEHLRWTKPEWRKGLDALAPAREASSTVPAKPSAPNPFDYDAKLHALAAVCARLRLTPANAEESLRSLEELQRLGFTTGTGAAFARELGRVGVPMAEAATRLADSIRAAGGLAEHCASLEARVAAFEPRARDAERQLETAKRTMESLQWNPADVAALRKLHDELAQARFGVADAAVLLEVSTELAALTGVATAEAAVIGRRCLETLVAGLRGAKAADAGAAIRLIAETGARGAHLDAEVTRMTAEVARLETRIATLDKQRELLERKKQAVDHDLHSARLSIEAAERDEAALVARYQKMQKQIDFAEDIVQFLAGKVGSHDVLWDRLADIGRVRMEGIPVVNLREIKDWTRKRILEILRGAVEEDTVECRRT
ncbi:MAG TPA: hypothetical protein VHF22_05020 [Planctomycetota bacterium]|nr:hypothetical protein [Planctomycetota bacterium]